MYMYRCLASSRSVLCQSNSNSNSRGLGKRLAPFGHKMFPICRTVASSSMGRGSNRKHKLVDLYYDDYDDDEDFYAFGQTKSLARSAPASVSMMRSTSTKLRDVMKPRNPIQERYISLLKNDLSSIVVATGPAGTGKSCIAVSVGIDLLSKNKYERIVISRPAVAVDEEHGFLPGTLDEKLDPWMRPLYDTFYKYYSVDKVKAMTANKTIDICPLAYLRGRTLENSFIIIDEAQNCSVKQMLMIMTRIGSGSKMVITGDPMQHDRGREKSGLTDLIQRLNAHARARNVDAEGETEGWLDTGIACVNFTADHIERHPVIKNVLALYDTDHMPSL